MLLLRRPFTLRKATWPLTMHCGHKFRQTFFYKMTQQRSTLYFLFHFLLKQGLHSNKAMFLFTVCFTFFSTTAYPWENAATQTRLSDSSTNHKREGKYTDHILTVDNWTEMTKCSSATFPCFWLDMIYLYFPIHCTFSEVQTSISLKLWSRLNAQHDRTHMYKFVMLSWVS